MDANLRKTNELRIKNVIKNLERRNMEGYYCETKEQAADLVMELLQGSKSVSWGGSMTLDEIGLKEKLAAMDIEAFDPYGGSYDGATIERRKESITKEAFLMSTNAVTMDGVLMNIDGVGNRVAALCFGPDKVIVVAGCNKIAEDEEDARKRIKAIACPSNGIRLGCQTPCVKTGKCADCTAPDCMCCSMVSTRFTRIKGRIKVVLVNEELGY